MLNNAQQVEQLLETNDKGARAQVGYDVTVKAINKIMGGKVLQQSTHVSPYIRINPTKQEDGTQAFFLPPGAYSLTFEQGITLPTTKTAFVRHRSSVLRCGATITSGVFDPGFTTDNLGAVMIVTEPITIEVGARVAQVIVFDNNDAEAYNGQWQGSSDLK